MRVPGCADASLPAGIKFMTEAAEGTRGYLAHSSGVQAVMVGKAWWQECEAAAHMASAVRKQREASAVWLLLSPRPSSHGTVLYTLRAYLPTSTQSRISITDVLRVWGIPT